MTATGYTSGDPGKVGADSVGQPGGPAGPLDEDGLIPAEQIPGGGGPGGAVDSVNSQTGAVVLDAGDVGADPVGSAAGLEIVLRADLLAKSGGTVTGPIALQALLTLARLSMTSPNDLTTLVTLVAPSAASTDPDDSANLLEMLQDSQPTWWLNENGNPRARAAKTTEAAERLYGLSGQAADIFQVLRTRSDPTVLVAAKPNGNLEALGNVLAANYKNSVWTALTPTSVAYTIPSQPDTDHEPSYRLEGAANEIVRLRGRFLVTSVTNNDVITTLPVGARPSKAIRAQVPNGQSTYIGVSIGTGGAVTAGRTVASASWVSLDGITFTTN